jgi:hypothetical protein
MYNALYNRMVFIGTGGDGTSQQSVPVLHYCLLSAASHLISRIRDRTYGQPISCQRLAPLRKKSSAH